MASMNTGSNEWATKHLRQMVIQQIEDTYNNYGNPTRKSSNEVEKHIMTRAQSRDDYLQMVARLILHIKEVRGSAMQQEGSMVNQAPAGTNNSMMQQSNLNNMPQQQAIRAMQNSLVQQLNAQAQTCNVNIAPSTNQPMQVTMQGSQIINRAPNMMVPQSQSQQIPQSTQMQKQLQSNPGLSMANTMQQNLIGVNMMSNTTTPSSTTNQQQQLQQIQQQKLQQAQQLTQQQKAHLQQQLPQQQLQQQQSHSQQQQQPQQQQQTQQQQKVNERMIMKKVQQYKQQQLQNQLQGVSQANNMSANQPIAQQGFTVPAMKIATSMQQSKTQSQPSPAKHISAPSPQMQQPVPSPQQPAPSPGSYNPPSVGPSPSPLTPAEEQQYFEKLKEMSKYIDPLTRLISHMPAGDDHKKDRDKMNGLLDMLKNLKRTRLSVLARCEPVLLRLFPDVASSNFQPSVPKMPLPPMGEVVKNVMSSAHIMTDARQNILPGMLALNAPMISPPPPPPKSRKRPITASNEPQAKKSPLPRALQMEIVHMVDKFKISLDPSKPADRAGVTMLCECREESMSQRSGTLSVRIPGNYPKSEPNYTLNSLDRSSHILTIENRMTKKLMRLPHTVTFTSVLIAWEQSIRENLMT